MPSAEIKKISRKIRVLRFTLWEVCVPSAMVVK